jgi:chromosome partitioning protein
MIVIDCGTNKGGIGKTALALFTAMTSSFYGYKTLLFDLDPQCGLSWRIDSAKKIMYNNNLVKDFFSYPYRLSKEKCLLLNSLLDVVPGDMYAERHDVDTIEKESVHGALRMLGKEGGYDVVVFDTGPRPTALEKACSVQSTKHLIPFSNDKASILGAVSRTQSLANMSNYTLLRENIVFIPWGVNIKEKTGKNQELIHALAQMFKDTGYIMTDVFPPIPDMTDLMLSMSPVTLDAFLKYPGLVRRKKEIMAFANRLQELIFL